MKTALNLYETSLGLWGLDAADMELRADLFRKASRQWHLDLSVENCSSNSSACDTPVGAPGRTMCSDEHDQACSPVTPPGAPPFDGTAMLRRCTGDDSASFKSQEQCDAMNAVADRNCDLLVVLPTGGGKTAVALGPMCLEQLGVSVWISPLRALAKETFELVPKCGLRAVPLSLPLTQDSQFNRGVVVVAREQVNGSLYGRMLRTLHAKQLLRRIVIDEAHIGVCSDGYRQCMVRLHLCRPTECDGVPIVMLTAIAPESLVPLIAQSAGCSLRTLRIIRADPGRLNLSFKVHCLQNTRKRFFVDRVLSEVAIALRTFRLTNTPSRAIVFCLTVADTGAMPRKLTETLGKLNDITLLHHHSQMPNEQRLDKVQKSYQCRTGLCVMVATEGYFVGTDSPNVRNVIFAGGARSL